MRRAARLRLSREALIAAAVPFVVTRLLFLVIGIIAPIVFSRDAVRTPPTPTGAGWIRWDSLWFLGIAAHGYRWSLDPSHYSAAAFFPLYPLLIRGVSALGLPPSVAGLILANMAFAAALYALYLLARLDVEPCVASRTLWLLATFPTAFATFIPYTESLFLLLAILTFLFLRRGEWWWAGAMGAAGALTRQTGAVLLVPFIIEWVRQDERRLRDLLPAALIPLLVAAHIAHLWAITGRPLAPILAQGAWHRRPGWPWSGILETVQRWTLHDTTGLQHVHMALELGAVIIFLALLLLGRRQLRPSYTAYAAVTWLVVLTSPAAADTFRLPLMSASRFALGVFPSFLLLSLLLRRPATAQAWLTASTMGLAFATTFFVLGGWVA